MMNPLVSIIVPTYNRPFQLHRALNSIQRQGYSRIEIVVVNDGETPVEDVVKEFPQAFLVNHEQNRGLPAARNTGLAYATGEYIGYLDDDDWLYPEHVRVCLANLWAYEARWVYTNAHGYYIDGQRRLYMDADYVPEGIIHNNITPVLCVLHERSLIDEAGQFDETLKNHEDWDLWIRFARICAPVHVKQITCCIDRSKNSMISNAEVMTAGREFVRARYAKKKV